MVVASGTSSLPLYLHIHASLTLFGQPETSAQSVRETVEHSGEFVIFGGVSVPPKIWVWFFLVFIVPHMRSCITTWFLASLLSAHLKKNPLMMFRRQHQFDEIAALG
ncbi:hypothetical protein TIFTF001_027842 [Ficus carica]|uniref:Uncharacterized protein n=1 Tax=Ficus carica TaxID=3494 RepID=A0AA88DPY4_FICCA|nr:hypothetical protein TIFTF001_027842 [Ficus carica]